MIDEQPGSLNRFLRRLRGAGFLLPAALTGYLWLKGLHPDLPGWSCPLRALTGIPCPTCFLTRATSAALTGDFGTSLHWHLFGPVAAAALVGWSVLAIRHRRLLPPEVKGGHLVLAAVALLLWWLVRLVLQFGMGISAFPAG